MAHFRSIYINFLIIFYSTHLLQISSSIYQNKNHEFNIKKRSLPLLFTNTSAITYITGFGIPVHNLNPELVTVGMVFKAQQFLPTTVDALRRHSNHSIHKRESSFKIDKDKNFPNYRLIFYKVLEQLLLSLGQAGKTCVLKIICEVAHTPFHHNNGIMGELMHILLTPSSSSDIFQLQSDYTYLRAERIGHKGKSCQKLYKDCNESLLDQITNVLH